MLKKVFVVIFLTATIAQAKIVIQQDKWNKTLNKDGITIYDQKVKGYDIIAFKAVSTFNIPVNRLLVLLRDAKGSKRWSDNLKHIEYIEQPDDISSIIYEIRYFPWPFLDRDVITNYQLTINKEKKSLEVDFHSVGHKKFPENKKYVRAKVHYGRMNFWPKGNKTKIELIILADPRGNIPTWIVNLFQVDVPFSYIKSMRAQAKKEKRALLPGIAKLLNEYYQLFPEAK